MTLSSSAKTKIGWILTGLVSLFLAVDAFGKIARIPQVLEACTKLGFSESVVPTIGFVLLVGLVLFLIPKTKFLGAIYLTGFLGGAVATNLRAGTPLFSNVLFPVYFGGLIWIGILLRDPNIATVLIGNSSANQP